jgi:hypothetical protein
VIYALADGVSFPYNTVSVWAELNTCTRPTTTIKRLLTLLELRTCGRAPPSPPPPPPVPAPLLLAAWPLSVHLAVAIGIARAHTPVGVLVAAEFFARARLTSGERRPGGSAKSLTARTLRNACIVVQGSRRWFEMNDKGNNNQQPLRDQRRPPLRHYKTSANSWWRGWWWSRRRVSLAIVCSNKT